MRVFSSETEVLAHYMICGNLYSKNGFLHHRRTIDSNVLILVKEGTLFIEKNQQQYAVGAGQYILLNANEEHFGYQPSIGKLSYLWVHFYFDKNVQILPSNDAGSHDSNRDSTQALSSHTLFFPEYGTLALSHRVLLMFNHLVDLSRQEALFHPCILDHTLTLLLMELTQDYTGSLGKGENKIPPNIMCVIEWVQSNCHRPFTIKELATEFGYSQDYLSALFRKSTGGTLIDFVNKSRINISKSLMGSCDFPLREIACSCGFSDEKYFLKTFKRYEGITPTQYRKSLTAPEEKQW